MEDRQGEWEEEESGIKDSTIPVEWVDEDEWAAIEQAFASACSNIHLISSSSSSSTTSQLPGTSNIKKNELQLASKEAQQSKRVKSLSLNGSLCRELVPCDSPPLNAVDADSKESNTLGGIRVNGNLDRDEPPRKQLRRTLPAWFEKNRLKVPESESLLISRQFKPSKGDDVPVDGLHTSLVQTNLSQLTCTWPMSHSAYQGEVKPKIQSLQFKGQLTYSKTQAEVDASVHEIWKIVAAKRLSSSGKVPMGFDMEWKTSFQRGEASGKVAVVQLCLENDRCDVMHIKESGVPPSLAKLLEDSSILKTGVGIYGDVAKLHHDYGVRIQGIVDLSSMANKKLATDRHSVRQWSLSSLAQELTGKQVDKVRSVRTGDWEACPLSQAQLIYAATDAFASLYLYQILESFPGHEDMDELDSKEFTKPN